MLSMVVDEQARAELTLDLDELFCEGARRLLAVALEAEVQAYIAAHTELTDGHGHRLVRRNGHARARTIASRVARSRWSARGWMTGAPTRATGERVQFQSVPATPSARPAAIAWRTSPPTPWPSWTPPRSSAPPWSATRGVA
jgi:hypothetical protein